jgi:thymidylate synthase
MSEVMPVLVVEADCLPEAWEKAVLAVWKGGCDVATEYDREGDPPSRDATVMVTVRQPFSEPRIHKNFPGGPAELEVYRQEVVDGIHDHWIDPAGGKWTYTYHQRLFAYLPAGRAGGRPVDQIGHIVDSLARAPHSRRAQASTWMPTADPETADPPCLQRVWCRLIEAGGRPVLAMNAHWRSRDLYKAWFMNVYALTELQRIIADRVAERLGRPVAVGRYVDVSDSLHIYGRDFERVGPEVDKMAASHYSLRAWDSTHPAFEAITAETREKLSRDPDWFARAKG